MGKQDVIIIGAGASGMMTAACTYGKKIKIIEKNKKIGKKLAATGNGKCNLANSHFSAECYHSNDNKELFSILNQHTYQEILKLLKQMGIYTYEVNGYYYPCSDQAIQVVNALRKKSENLGAIVHLKENVLNVEKQKDGFLVLTNQGEYACKKLVLSCGSMANEILGGTKTGYQLASIFGHDVTDLFPALTGLSVLDQNISIAKGVRCKASATLYSNQNEIAMQSGELQIADAGLSGIMIFNLSTLAAKALNRSENVTIHIDFLPHYTVDDIKDMLLHAKENFPNYKISEILNGFVHEKLASYILKKANINGNMQAVNCSDELFTNFISYLKNKEFNIVKNLSFSQAQVVSGGIPLNEVNLHTMESKLCKNLYITGELLDVDGICGGYNLMWAFLTGYLAGKAITDDNLKRLTIKSQYLK